MAARIADGIYKQRKKRRKLCSEHGLTCPRQLDKDTQGGATLEHVRRQLEKKASALGSKEIESKARSTSLPARGTSPPRAGGHAAERPADDTRHATEQEQRAGGSGDGRPGNLAAL